ncbi:hypothetical protein BV898_14721 [Hypsibius exemplaris]|uniref:Uncharacterized protein n=1 Tax=Hypsibius exemplaris TaxID=2072580 RepID=A0A9X6RJT9_HYPEX|nr:hypothetical protein BV898_14721 [Hypsibius exemplaris]
MPPGRSSITVTKPKFGGGYIRLSIIIIRLKNAPIAVPTSSPSASRVRIVANQHDDRGAARTLPVILLCGSFYLSYIQIGTAVYQMFSSTEEGSSVALLTVLSDIPYGVYCMRAFLVLVLLLHKRDAWSDLTSRAGDLLSLSRLQDIPGKITSLSRCLLCLTVCTHLAYELIEYSYFWVLGGQSWLCNFANISVVPTFEDGNTWQFVCLYGCFSVFPFVLSQQVMVGAIALASVLQHVIRSVNEDILMEERRWETGLPVSAASVDDLRKRIDTWEYLHAKALLLVQAMNECFSPIFGVAYTLDLFVSISFAAWYIGTAAGDHGEYAVSLGSVALFLAYATLLPMPFVRVHNVGRQLPGSLHSLRCRYKQQCSAGGWESGSQGLEEATRTYDLLFTGMGLIRFSSRIVGATATIVLTFLLLAGDVLRNLTRTTRSNKDALQFNITSNASLTFQR